MNRDQILEVLQYLEMLKNNPYASYTLMLKSDDYKEAYNEGFEKGVSEAIRVIAERLEPFE